MVWICGRLELFLQVRGWLHHRAPRGPRARHRIPRQALLRVESRPGSPASRDPKPLYVTRMLHLMGLGPRGRGAGERWTRRGHEKARADGGTRAQGVPESWITVTCTLFLPLKSLGTRDDELSGDEPPQVGPSACLVTVATRGRDGPALSQIALKRVWEQLEVGGEGTPV